MVSKELSPQRVFRLAPLKLPSRSDAFSLSPSLHCKYDGVDVYVDKFTDQQSTPP